MDREMTGIYDKSSGADYLLATSITRHHLSGVSRGSLIY